MWRRIIPTIIISALTCWTSVPLEIAQKTFWADQNFSKELRKGYTSIFDVLRRVPFEEGPAHLFKNGFPTMSMSFLFTGITFMTYDYLLDFFHPLHQDFGTSAIPGKAVAACFALLVGSSIAYPYGYAVRSIMEYSPHQQIEFFKGKYSKVFYQVAFQNLTCNSLNGYGQFLLRRGPNMLVMLWVAEWMGLFKSWRTDYTKWPGVNKITDIQG